MDLVKKAKLVVNGSLEIAEIATPNKSIITISDDFHPSMDKNRYKISKLYEPYVDHVLINCDQIEQRTKSLAAEIQNQFKNEPITLLCVLKGSFPFFSLLYRELANLRCSPDLGVEERQPIFIDFLRLKSYTNTKSTGSVQVCDSLLPDLDRLKGRHVFIVEDIVDTGRSMETLLPLLSAQNVASTHIVTLLKKRVPGCKIEPQFIGFEIPDKFVIGFGLDYNEFFREMQHICVINQSGVEKFKNL